MKRQILIVLACLVLLFGTAYGETLISDDFNDGVIDSNLWNYGGYRVVEEDGIIKVEITVTDQEGWLKSEYIDINAYNELVIERNVKVHYANEYYKGWLGIEIEQIPENSFGIIYRNQCCSAQGPAYDFYLMQHNIYTGFEMSDPIEPIWDQWFDEKIIYHPQTGLLEYFINGQKKMEYTTDFSLSTDESYRFRIHVHNSAWYTGHYQHFDDIVVSQNVLERSVPDTGQIKCYDDQGNEILPCPDLGQRLYGQDANYIINPQSYTKLDAQGNDLPESATVWAMVRDNVTGLIWEIKTDDGYIHDKDDTYWFDDL